jgi:hypothetical protein
LKHASLKNEAMDTVPKKKTVSDNFRLAVFSLWNILALEDGTDRLYRNVGKELPVCAA